MQTARALVRLDAKARLSCLRLFRREMLPNNEDETANIESLDREQSDLGFQHLSIRHVCLKTWNHYGICNVKMCPMLFIAAKLFIFFDTITKSPKKHRDFGVKQYMAPIPSFATTTYKQSEYVKYFQPMVSGLFFSTLH